MASYEDRAFVVLLAAVSLAFAVILWPFFGAVFWAAVFAIVFAPLNRWLCRHMGGRRTRAAVTSVGVILLIVILPAALVTALLVQEVLAFFGRVQSGEISFREYFQQLMNVLPQWMIGLLERFGLTNLGGVQDKLSAGFAKGAQVIGTQAFAVGQNTLEVVVSFFLMLYVLFFLLRDGPELSARIKNALPLREGVRREFAGQFTTVIRATVKGNVVVALVQGTLGGLIFWFLGIHGPLLWGVVMAFLSLLPAVGTALVWLPVAIYLLATGAIWKGVILIAFGVLVIGLVDNLLRPILVGKETRMPDYVVLVSTLGGLAVFGVNGFVIGPVIAAMFIAAWSIFGHSRGARRA